MIDCFQSNVGHNNTNMNEEAKEILEELDQLWLLFKKCRAHFPAVSKSIIGKKIISTAPYYFDDSSIESFVFRKALDDVDINKLNEIGHWINQNFIIRLCAMLEHKNILPNEGKGKIDQTIDDWQSIDLIRRLRNYFVHSSGRFYPTRGEYQNTAKAIGEYLGVKIENSDNFDLNIQKVLAPLFQGCKQYVESKFIGL